MGRDGKTLNVIIYVYQTTGNELTIALHGLHFNDVACTVCRPMVHSDKDAASTSAARRLRTFCPEPLSSCMT